MSHIQATLTTTPDLADFCRRWYIQELAVFGSILRDDFDAGNDVDVQDCHKGP